ncbi:unnamed protein product [Urochloa humidicola]
MVGGGHRAGEGAGMAVLASGYSFCGFGGIHVVLVLHSGQGCAAAAALALPPPTRSGAPPLLSPAEPPRGGNGDSPWKGEGSWAHLSVVASGGVRARGSEVTVGVRVLVWKVMTLPF